MEEINANIKEFVENVKQSYIYKDYSKYKEIIKEHPELMIKVNEFRERNFRLQMSGNPERLFDEVDQFTDEYEKILEIPLVHDFLEKELAYCRMVQEINAKLLQAFAAEFE